MTPPFRSPILLLSVIFLFLKGLYAQQSAPNVFGVVQDAATGLPLRGVSIEAENALYGSISNNAGEFSLQVNSAEAVAIHFSRAGYLDTEMVFRPTPSPAVVKLNPEKTTATATPTRVSESTLRLNLIRKLISLTTWSDQAARKNRALTIALIGNNPFGEDLYAFEDIELNNRPIVVEFLQSPDEIKNQDVLIVSRANNALVEELNTKLAGMAILVICNECGSSELPAASLNIFREGETIRYTANKGATRLTNISFAPVVYELSAQ